MGVQQTPPNMVLVGISIFLTLFIMNPVISDINTQAYTPYKNNEITQEVALERAQVPLKRFMLSNTTNSSLRLFTDKKLELKGLNILWEGWRNTTELLIEYTKGGFGLVWEQSVQQDYYKSCQPHKLAAYLAAGIQVIMEKGLPHEQTVLDYELGFVTDSLEEAVARVKQVTEEEYRRLADHAKPIGNLVKGGFFTKKLLIDAVNYLMLG